MSAKQQTSMLSVRLPIELVRESKVRAAAQGETLQRFVRESLEATLNRAKPWPPGDLERLLKLRGSLAGTSVLEDMRRDREEELAKDERRLAMLAKTKSGHASTR